MKPDLQSSAPKGRGVLTNSVSRYERVSRHQENDGWDCDAPLPTLRTEVSLERPRSMISYNRSPELQTARRGLVRVGISVTTLDARLSRLMEPRAPSPARRLQIVRRLSAAGVPVRIMAAPMVPALTDPELEAILSAGKTAGARTASWIMLRLPQEVSPLWQEWLAGHYPDRAGRIMARLREMHGGNDYDARWGRRMRGQGPYAQMIAARFSLAIKRLGLKENAPHMRCDLFQLPVAPTAQLSLF